MLLIEFLATSSTVRTINPQSWQQAPDFRLSVGGVEGLKACFKALGITS
jgi:hypothetical protein